MMEIRNPTFNRFGTIDCEVNHPSFGWIPFTADPNDPEAHGREIFAAALESGPDAYVPPTPTLTHEDVNRERDRRLVLPFTFMGNSYDRTPQSLARITGAATLAGFAVAAGAKPGNLLWHGGQSPFSWITATNTVVEMDAPTAFAFGQAAAAVETRLIFAAFALKQGAIPADYAEDSHWP